MRTVPSSVAPIPGTSRTAPSRNSPTPRIEENAAGSAPFESWIERSNERFTSAAVSGAPSWSRTFFLSEKTNDRSPSATSQRSASHGTT